MNVNTSANRSLQRLRPAEESVRGLIDVAGQCFGRDECEMY